jgi:hypothetical protein
MSNKRFTLDQLTEGIRQRHLGAQNRRLVEKWSRTGLLRGLDGVSRENMAALLENQAAQLLRESNSLSTGAASLSSSGDIRGFTNVAFPIVRRVFGGLVANELVSIQPMSLPSGLLFYLDYTYGTARGGNADQSGTGNLANTADSYAAGGSIYNIPAGAGVRSGSTAAGGMYDLAGTAYSRVHSGSQVCTVIAEGAYQGTSTITANVCLHTTGTDGKLLQFDPQITKLIEDSPDPGAEGATGGTGFFTAVFLDLDGTTSGNSVKDFANADLTMVKEIALYVTASTETSFEGCNMGNGGYPHPLPDTVQGGTKIVNVRRLNQLGTYSGGVFTSNPYVTTATTNAVLCAIISGTITHDKTSNGLNTPVKVSYPLSPTLSASSTVGDALTIPTFESNFATSPSPAIPEIDIKIESIAVTAVTRKLRARWSPELAQDLNAYHSLDAEVELTQILSEQIALELDREILNDLLTQARGANYYWSRAPGKFLNKETGAVISRGTSLQPGPAFTGTVREWYETLIETVIDVANTIHRKTLRGSANFCVVGPDVATILEASVLYRPQYSLDGDGQVGAPFSLGAEKVGTLSNRFTVYKDPYFPRNKILVGYKGGSYLETGYVYAPYVPLIVTPTIFAPEDFTPRKGVMTRYGKKMVRGDFYGTVTVADMNII